MKKILAVAALVAVSSVNAQDLKFGDLNYFLKQGQFNLGVNAIVHNETARVNKTDKSEVDGYLFDARAAIGLMDNLNVGVDFTYIFNGETTIGNSTYDVDGIQNPKFFLNYRLANQGKDGLNFDIGAVGTVKVMDRETGSKSKDKAGNMYSPVISNMGDPRNSVEVNARLGRKWDEANEVYFVGAIIHSFDGDYKDLETDETVDMDGQNDYKLGAFYQYRPVNEFMMTLGLTGIRYNDTYVETNGTKSKYRDHVDMQFSFDAKYLVSDNTIVKFMFRNDRRDKVVEETSKTQNDKRTGAQYGLGVDFLF